MIKKSRPNLLTEALQTTRPVFVHMALFSFFINLLMLMVPMYSLQVLDRVLSTGSVDTLIWLSVIMVAAFLAAGFLQLMRSFALIRLGEWMDDAMSRSLLLLSLINAAGTAMRSTQNLRDLNTIRNFLTGSGLLALFDAPWSILFLLAIFLIHTDLGVITLLGCFIMLGLAWLNEIAMKKPLDEANETNVQNLQQVDIAMRNAEVIEGMGMTNTIADGWNRANRAVQELQTRASCRSAIVQALTRFIRLDLQIAITGWGAYLALTNHITSGSIIAASILSARALAPFDTAISTWKTTVETRKSYHRLNDALDAMSTRSSGTSLPKPEGNLEVARLVYLFPKQIRPILKGVSFKLDAGDCLGIVGPSAAGKSTLGKLIVGAWKPYSGAVRLDGGDVCQWNREEFGHYVGYLPQDVELFSGTVKENIARMQPDASDAAIVRAAQMAGSHELILMLPNGYETDIGPGGAALSAGQRQRIGLARALFGEPKLLVLDEPDASLDVEGEQALANALGNARKQHITTIVVSHRRTLLRYVDKMLVLNDGNVSHFGPAQEVIAALAPVESAPDKDRQVSQLARGRENIRKDINHAAA